MAINSLETALDRGGLDRLDLRMLAKLQQDGRIANLKLAIPRMEPADFRAAKESMARYEGSESPQEWADPNLDSTWRCTVPVAAPSCSR